MPPAAYAYLLGLYLGDGCISRASRTQRLRITLDAAYPDIIDACLAAIGLVKPGRAPSLVPRRSRAVDVSSYGNAWLSLLPQHGRGPKHTRRIALEPWQEELVRASPRWFVKGLFDSDGSYVVNRVHSSAGQVYTYDRYFFSNRSDDIRRLFIWACGLVGAEARQTGKVNVSVSRRDSVAILNGFLGPKR